jgi:hypothetical protein
MSAAEGSKRRSPEQMLRNYVNAQSKLEEKIPKLTGKELEKAKGQLAKLKEEITKKEAAIAAAAEKAIARAAAEANAETRKAQKAANKAAGIKQTRKLKTANERLANAAKQFEAAKERAAKAVETAAARAAAEETRAAKAVERAATKAAKEAAATGTKTRKNNPYVKFTSIISKGYKNTGKTLKKGVTYPSVISAYKRSNPSRYANFVANPNAFNMSNVVEFINTYNPNTNERKMNKEYNKLVQNLFGNNSAKKVDLQKKLQKTQKKCSEAISELEKQIAALNAVGVNAAAAESAL